MTKVLKHNFLRVTVLGAGSWGTALAHHLASNNYQVRLWAFEPEVVLSINRNHENKFFMPNLRLHPSLIATNDFAYALNGAVLVLLVMPSHVLREVLLCAAPYIPEEAYIISCAKGLEQNSGYTMCEVAKSVLPKFFHHKVCCLSGPSIAREMTMGVPTAVTVASYDYEVARAIQLIFARGCLRVYTSPDLIGVELGGSIKNPLAIAAGMVSGLSLGHNTLAALITRGLAEMVRLACAKGALLSTLSGLSGLGDLVLTCTSSQSRNYSVGIRLTRGDSITKITTSSKNVAEGILNTLTVLELAKQEKVEMPIVRAVYKVIYQTFSPTQVLYELMSRELKTEYY